MSEYLSHTYANQGEILKILLCKNTQPFNRAGIHHAQTWCVTKAGRKSVSDWTVTEGSVRINKERECDVLKYIRSVEWKVTEKKKEKIG